MRLTFLGTSHGVPEANRKCSSALIEVSGRYYFIDMGMDVMNEIITRGISLDDIKGVFVTHAHGDHTNGLVPFTDLINWYFTTADPEFLLPDESIIRGLKAWLSGTEGNELRSGIRMEVYSEGLIYDDGYLKVTAFRNQHIVNSYSLLVEAEGKRILFTGDLKNPGIDFPKAEGTIDLLVCESAHFPSTDYVPVVQQMDIKRILINHYGPKFYRYIPLYQDAMAPLPVEVATDGLTICF